MTDQSPILVWHRRDFRLSDHPALHKAAESGRPVIPVFVFDEVAERLGTAPQWRLGLAVEHFAGRLEEIGSRLICRRGTAKTVLQALVEETGAGAVWWMRAYDPDSIERDEDVKSTLKAAEIDAQSFEGHLMREPWTIETKTGGFYKVYTPYMKAVYDRDVAEPLSKVSKLAAPDRWPDSDVPASWKMGAGMRRGADVVRPYVQLGEEAAQSRLGVFMAHKVESYDEGRDIPSEDRTSCLSENLSLGEISVQQCWHAGVRAREAGKAGAKTFLQELIWREFAYHLLWHTPRIVSENWREEWDAFPWNEDERLKEVKAWKQGRTGMAFVDAAMREMYVTGRMHNRGRMIVASYLCKHLMCHWKIGKAWFDDCLIDWDPASNAMGWQWSAGSGPDATPYFRVFNPETQLDRFDKKRVYVNRWIAEGQKDPPEEALSYFKAIPERWNMTAEDAYPDPIVGADEGRKAALDAYENRDF